MWQRAAATSLVIGLVLSGLRASEVSSTPPRGAPREFVGPYHRYNLKLQSFCPRPNRVAGVLLRVRINGGRPLGMVLDSGADLIVIGAKAARSVGFTGGSKTDLVGLGNRAARVGRVATLGIGPISFRNCCVGVVEGNVVEGADGVIPLSLFSKFLLRLDLPNHRLELIPYARGRNPTIPPTRGVRRHDLLLVPSVLNGKHKGYVILDTGAYCSAISRKLARTLSGFPMMTDVPLAAGTGTATGQRISSIIHFAIAENDLIPRDVVALDLSNLSHHYGVEIIGLLGFPALSNHILTIDYHNGWVKIEPPQNLSAPELLGGDGVEPRVPLAFR